MPLHHRLEVHAVELVRGKDQDIGHTFAFGIPKVLAQGISGATVPVTGLVGLLGAEYFNKPAMERIHLVGVADMPVQANALVLGQNEDTAQTAIEAVADRHIY